MVQSGRATPASPGPGSAPRSRPPACRSGASARPASATTPPIVAQTIGTLAQMFPGRFWTALASGEAMNESHHRRPLARARTSAIARLEECVDVIRAPPRRRGGQPQRPDHRRPREGCGRGLRSRRRCWSRPSRPASAARAAAWADGLITVNQRPETLREVIAAYRGAGGRGPVALQLHLSWAPTMEEAERDRPRPMAHRTCLAQPLALGHRHRRRLRRGLEARHPGVGARRGAHLVGPGPARRMDPRIRRPRVRRHLPALRRARTSPTLHRRVRRARPAPRSR